MPDWIPDSESGPGWIPDEPEPSTILGEAGKGLRAGVQQIRGMGYGLGAIAGKVVESPAITDWAREGLADVEAKTPKPAVGSFSDIKSAGDVGKYLSYGVATNLPNMALSLVSGGVGGVLGKKVVGKAAEEVVKKAITRGFVGGAFGASLGMEAGSIAGDQLTEAGEVSPGRAVAGAIPAALLDVVPEWYLAKRLGWIGGKATVREGGRLLQSAKEFGKQFALEAPTEAAQSVIERASVPGKSISNADAWDEYINSFILGGATGGFVGGIGGVLTKKADERETPVQQVLKDEPIANDIEQQMADLADENEAIKIAPLPEKAAPEQNALPIEPPIPQFVQEPVQEVAPIIEAEYEEPPEEKGRKALEEGLITPEEYKRIYNPAYEIPPELIIPGADNVEPLRAQEASVFKKGEKYKISFARDFDTEPQTRDLTYVGKASEGQEMFATDEDRRISLRQDELISSAKVEKGKTRPPAEVVEFKPQSAINKLELSLTKWREQGLDRTLPEEYARYSDTLARLKNGEKAVTKDVTEETIREVGSLLQKAVKVGKEGKTLGEIADEKKAVRQPIFNKQGYGSEAEALAMIKSRKLPLADYSVEKVGKRWMVMAKEMATPAPQAEAAPEKQLWEMSRDEFAKNQGKDSPYVQQQRDAIVKQAVARGESVPVEVLADYPDLQSQLPAGNQPQPEAAAKPEEKVIPATKPIEAAVTTPKEQKAYVQANVEGLIKDARERWRDQNGGGTDLNDKDLDAAILKGRFASDRPPDGASRITIEVPNDGQYRIDNNLRALLTFQKNLPRMTAPSPKMAGYPSSKAVGKSPDIVAKEAEAEVELYNASRENKKQQYQYYPEWIAKAEAEATRWRDIEGDVDTGKRTLKSLAQEFRGRVPSRRDLDAKVIDARNTAAKVKQGFEDLKKDIAEHWPGLDKEIKTEELPGMGEEKPKYALAPAKVTSLVDNLKKITGISAAVEIVTSPTQIPDSVYDDMVSKGIMSVDGEHNVKGVYDPVTGQIFLFPENIRSEKDAMLVISHEIFHDGWNRLFNSMPGQLGVKYKGKSNSILDDIWANHEAAIRGDVGVTHAHLDLSTKPDQRQAANEWLANQAYDSQPKWYDKIVTLLRNFMRDIFGTDLQFSDSEIRTLIQDVGKAMRDANVSGGTPQYMVSAWHGGRELEGGRFDTRFIGTGEGAQAFGWGLYFTDQEGVAKWYADEVAKRNPDELGWRVGDKIIKDSATPFGTVLNNYANGMSKEEIVSSLQSWITNLSKLPQSYGAQDSIQWGKEAIDYAESVKEPVTFWEQSNKKNLYQVSLHKGKTPDQYNWLEWDKAVSEEIKGKIESQLKKELPQINIESVVPPERKLNYLEYVNLYKRRGYANEQIRAMWEAYKNIPESEMDAVSDGAAVYSRLSNLLSGKAEYTNSPPQKEASLFLLRAGIDGIKYPAGSLSGMKTEASNYVVFDPSAITVEQHIQYALATPIKDVIAKAASTFENNPQGIPQQWVNNLNSHLAFYNKGRFKLLDAALNVPFRMAQKYPEWKRAWQVHGVERAENRTNLTHQLITTARDFINMDADWKKAGLSPKEIEASKHRIERVLIAGDIMLHDRMANLLERIQGTEGQERADLQNQINELRQLKRYSDKELKAGVKDEYGQVTKLNDREIKAYVGARQALDQVFETYIDHLSAMAFRTYQNQKWYNILLTATGMDLTKETTQIMLGKKGLNKAALAYAKKIQPDLQAIFERLEQGITEVPESESMKAKELFAKATDTMAKELQKFQEYLGQLTGTKDKVETAKLAGQVFTAYMQTRPQLKRIKQIRNDVNQWIGFFPRTREQGKHKYKVVEQVFDPDTGALANEREVYSKMFDNKGEALDVLADIKKRYADKNGNLPPNWIIKPPEASTVTPEAAFQGASDINMQKIFDDAMNRLDVKGKMYDEQGKPLQESKFYDAQGKEINFQDQLREAGYEAIANQLASRGGGAHGIHRKAGHIKGYDEVELQKVLLNYISGMSGLMTKQVAAADSLDLMKTVKDPAMFAGLKRYISEQLRNETQIDRVSSTVRSLAFLNFLGGVLKAPIINLTQNPIVGFAELGKYMRENRVQGIADTRYIKAMSDTARNKLTPLEQRLIEELISSGIAQDQFIRSVFGQVKNSKFMQRYESVAEFLAKPFSLSEIYNRKSAGVAIFRAAYPVELKKAQSIGLKGNAAEDEAYKNTFEIARTFIDNVHYAYGKTNRPLLMQSGDFSGAALSTLYTFKGFTHNFLARQAELLSQRDFRTLLHTLAYMGLFGGLMGLPFFKDLFDWIEKHYGYSPVKAIRRELRGIGGDTLEAFGVTGLPSLMGANLSGSLAIGLPWPIGAEDPADSIFGVYGGMAQSFGRAVQAAGRGDTGRAASEAMPQVVKGPLVALRESEFGRQILGTPGFATTTKGRPVYDEEGKPLQITGGEVALKAIGFNPARYSRQREKMQTVRRQEDWATEAKANAAETYRFQKLNNDPKAMANLMKAVQEINEGIRSRDIERLVPRATVGKVLQSSRQIKTAQQRREIGYRQGL